MQFLLLVETITIINNTNDSGNLPERFVNDHGSDSVKIVCGYCKNTRQKYENKDQALCLQHSNNI